MKTLQPVSSASACAIGTRWPMLPALPWNISTVVGIACAAFGERMKKADSFSPSGVGI
jgi:hypothetical protein